MASLLPFLIDGLSIDFDGTRLSATVPYHVTDLTTPAGGDPLDRLAEAMSVAGVPAPGDHRELLGRDIYALRYRIAAWSDADAELHVTFAEDEAVLGGTGIETEVGSTLELGETDFEASERIKAWNLRTPMYVLWDPGAAGAAVDAVANRQAARLPYFAGKPFRRYTKTISEDPGEMAETFVGRVNESAWKGYPIHSVMCVAIVGRNAGEGFRTTFDFAIDRITLHRQVARARDKTTGDFVAVTNAQAAAYNGIKDFQVQLEADFNALPV